ncbi:unnamed protein product [Prunus armeniaca]|uniref:Uncharacterized protein n=1 Tax=Prunus armeniaca TaxID=36596 RepID=A0A6J5TQ55_PRUAR|nr:unnamed protein product [Prunus armeniaca]CAB4295923.1 unnamed protein product [Prunus armeniaca]
MNQKFGGGRLPTGTPSLAWSSVVVVVSLLAGASVVHNLYKPDLALINPMQFVQTLPPVDGVNGSKEGKQPEKE